MNTFKYTVIACGYIGMAVVICVQIVQKLRGDRLPIPPATEPEEPAMASTAAATCDQPESEHEQRPCGAAAYPASVTCRNGHTRTHLMCAFHYLFIALECFCPDCHQVYLQINPVTVTTPQEES